MEGFKAVLEDNFLTELDLCGGRFTWEKSRGTKDWVKERLDRAFATTSWWRKFPLCKLTMYHTSVSDHEPILLDLFNVSISKKFFRFKFENTWLKEPNFHTEVMNFWADIPSMHLLPKLISVSSFMEKWGRNFFHKFREKIKQEKEIIVNLVNYTDEGNVKLYLEAKEKLNEILKQEEDYWRQRAKIFLLQDGDTNTKFFHAMATTRKKNNHVMFLETDTGERVEDHEGMCQIVKDYFTGVFACSNDVNVQDSSSANVVTAEQNSELVKEVTYEEFSLAIKQMHPDKASGPDGLNPAFFQHF